MEIFYKKRDNEGGIWHRGVTMLIQSRQLFEAVCNFRDLGGIRTADGRIVRHHQLFRSGEVSYATQEDLQLLEQLELKTILDYRDEEEALVSPTPTLRGADYIRISATLNSSLRINPAVEQQQHTAVITPSNFARAYMQLPYKNPAYRALMEKIMSKDVPLLHHCTAGKDRTGVATALVYLLLGVEEDVIVDEFLQSNIAIATEQPEWFVHWQQAIGHIDGFEQIATANERFLRATFAHILQTYGNYANYFEQEFNISAAMRADIQRYYLK